MCDHVPSGREDIDGAGVDDSPSVAMPQRTPRPQSECAGGAGVYTSPLEEHHGQMNGRRVPGAQKGELVWVCPRDKTVKLRKARSPECPKHKGEMMVPLKGAAR